VPGEAPPPGLTEELELAYRERQRGFELQARGEIERLYHHADVQRGGTDIALHQSDLFSEVSWRLFGLERGQLARYGVGWGAVLGGGVDLMVGGTSFLAGLIGGAVVGGLGGYFASTKVAKTFDSSSALAKVLFAGETGQFLFKGPVSSPRYAWMLVDRALAHFRAVRDRSHARRDKLALPEDAAGARGDPTVSGGSGGSSGSGGSGEASGSGGASGSIGADGEGDSGYARHLRAELRDRINKDLLQLLKEARRRAVSQEVRDNLALHVDAALQEL
jgi:hypothetical protein